MNDWFVAVEHMYVISVTVDIVVAVAVLVLVLVLAELNIVCAVDAVDQMAVLFDNFRPVDIAMVAAEELHDLHIVDDADDKMVSVRFAVACNDCVVVVVVVGAVIVADDTFHFGYLMAVCSALLMLMVCEVVLVQCDFVDCSIVDQPLMPPVAAAAMAAATAAAVTFVDKESLGSDEVPVDTVLWWLR